MLKIGMLVDNHFKILRQLGRGGSSCVYLAENTRLHNYWAVKEVFKSRMVRHGGAGGLIADAGILTKLRHPCLPSVIDIIETNESYLVIMEYIPGVGLDQVLQSKGAQSEQDVIRWGIQLCEVLVYLHTQASPIVYLDMKPANIILKPDGNIVLIDFGMAHEVRKINPEQVIGMGTYGYAAPEQHNRQLGKIDPRTDIYALGVTLYQLVTGLDPSKPPYTLQPIRTVNRLLSAQLEAIIQKCTQNRQQDRYQKTADLLSDLRRHSAGAATQTTAPARVPVAGPNAKKKSQSAWWVFLLIPVVLLVLLVPVVLLLSGGSELQSQPDDFYYEDPMLYCDYEISVTYADERVYFYFVPEVSGVYNIYSLSDPGMAPIVWVVDAADQVICKDNVDGSYSEVDSYCQLNAGERYYVETTLYDLGEEYVKTGSYYLCFDYVDDASFG